MWREIKGYVAVYERLLATQTEDITQEFYRTEPERFSVRKSNCMLHYNELITSAYIMTIASRLP